MEVVKFVDENIDVDVIDINMGCFVNKIVNIEVGFWWLLDFNKVYEMVFYVIDVVKKFVIVKMWMGWDD